MFSFNKIVVVCWIIFWLYWLISAFGSKKSVAPQIKRFFGIRLGFFVVAVILFHFLNVQNYSFQNRVATNNRAVLGVGLIIFLSGLALAIWARLYLGKNWGMPMTQKQSPELVMSGPYHYIRHPIYTCILTAMLGSAIASSIFWLTIFAITAFYFIYCAFEEEKIMMKQFPKDYPAYKNKTKMLIPFVI
jgi:protein-S-isoprenylcysteine O-methyltransferase Ste14